MGGVLKIYDELESPNKGSCSGWMYVEPLSPNEGACLICMMKRNRQTTGLFNKGDEPSNAGDIFNTGDEPVLPNEGCVCVFKIYMMNYLYIYIYGTPPPH